MKDIQEYERISVSGNNLYRSFSKGGFEPLVIVKWHHLKEGDQKRINISEELILYFDLYEECKDELNRTYYYIHLGEKEPVIKVSSDEVRIKQKYLLGLEVDI